MHWVFNWAVTGPIDLTESVLNKEGEHRVTRSGEQHKHVSGEFEMLGNGMEQSILVDVTAVKYVFLSGGCNLCKEKSALLRNMDGNGYLRRYVVS